MSASCDVLCAQGRSVLDLAAPDEVCMRWILGVQVPVYLCFRCSMRRARGCELETDLLVSLPAVYDP